MNDFQHLCAHAIFQLGFSAGLLEVLLFGQLGHSGFDCSLRGWCGASTLLFLLLLKFGLTAIIKSHKRRVHFNLALTQLTVVNVSRQLLAFSRMCRQSIV